ncbi:MAG: ATP-binding cassette domain-containing protein [Pseudomonadota bacterium]
MTATPLQKHMSEPLKGEAPKRLTDSKPVLDMLALLSKGGRKNFHEGSMWEVCLCVLILKIEKGCKVQRILEALPHGDQPMDEADILNTMAHLGYFCRTAKAKVDNIDARLLPAVFIPRKGDPSILVGRDNSSNLQYYDPTTHQMKTIQPNLDREGKVWFFQKYDENRRAISQFMRKGSGHSWFRALLGRFKGTFAQVLTAGLVLNIIALATPLFIMLVYDRVIAAGAPQTLPMLVLGAVIALIFEWKLRAIRSNGLSWLAGRLDNVVGNKIFAHLIGLAPSLIEKASVSAQIARIKTFESVRDFFSGSVFLSLLEAPFVLVSVVAIAVIAGPLVFVPLLMALGYILLFIFIRHKVMVAIRVAAKASSARQQFAIETFEKMEGIRGQGLSQKWQEKFRHLSGRELMMHFKLGWLGMVAETLAHALTTIAAVATVGFGVHLIWAGTMSAGALVATMILVWRILTPFYSLCTMVPRLEQLRNSIIQVNDLMDIKTEREEAKSHSQLPKVSGAIAFHNVDLQYGDDGDRIFSNLSFEARAGDFIALTGANGTGKATVLKLIKSLHKPTNGAVRIDGFDIRQLNAPALRREIAYAPKTPHMFRGSVLENMRFANPLASLEDVKKALSLAAALADVEKLADGLDTVIGADAPVQLTAHLTMRLSLARAYLHPARILLIDELPNTLLSGAAGKNLKEYLIRAKGKRTVIICTYREDYMKLADTIIWLRGLEPPIVRAREDFFKSMDMARTAA